jgi:hypothetical protein
MVLEPVAAPDLFIGKPEPLHHGAHRTIEDDDAPVEQLAQIVDGGLPRHGALITMPLADNHPLKQRRV